MEARITRVRPLALALLALLFLADAAIADTAPKLLSPANGKTLARDSHPVFKVRDTGKAHSGRVWLTISSTKKRDRYGKLARNQFGTFTSMRRGKRGVYTYQPPAYTFDSWFMHRPGKYYWQAFHINCAIPNASRSSCNVYSRIRSFRIQ